MKNTTGLTCCGEERKEQLKELCAGLGITMHHYELLNLALTHTSFAHETPHYPHNEHNERLEFLGDSVLGLIVSTYMFEHFPHFDEGRMTKLRAQVVCEASLYQCAKRIGLGDYLRMGNGELSSGGNKRPSILADAFEAVLYHDRVDVSAWGKLYHRSIFDSLRFPRSRLYEDTFVFGDVLNSTPSYIFGGSPQYHYVQRESSIVNRGFSENTLQFMDSVQRLTETALRSFPDLDAACLRRTAHAHLSVLRYMQHLFLHMG